MSEENLGEQYERKIGNGNARAMVWNILSIISLAFAGFLGASMYVMNGTVSSLQTDLRNFKEKHIDINLDLIEARGYINTLNEFKAETKGNRWTDKQAGEDYKKLDDRMDLIVREADKRLDRLSSDVVIMRQRLSNLPPKDLLQTVQELRRRVDINTNLLYELRRHHPAESGPR